MFTYRLGLISPEAETTEIELPAAAFWVWTGDLACRCVR